MANPITSVKNLNDALKETLSTLKDINQSIKDITAQGNDAANNLRSTITKTGQRNNGKGNRQRLGVDNAQITVAQPGGSENTVPASQPGSAFQSQILQQTTMPWLTTYNRVNAGLSVAQGVGQVTAGIAGAAYSLAPDLGTTVARAGAYFTTAQFSPSPISYTSLQKSTISALYGSFGRGISGLGEDAAAAAQLVQGYGYAPGSAAYLATMGEVGGAYRQLNMGNAQAAAAIGGLQTGTMGANLYQFGIAQFDKNGKPLTETQIARELYSRIFQNPKTATASNVQQSLQYGIAGADLNALGLSADQQQIFRAQFLDIAQGKNPDLAKASGVGNPLNPQQQITASQTNLMQAAQNSMIIGYQHAADVIELTNKSLIHFQKTLDVMSYGKGFVQGMSGSGIGGAAASATTGLLKGGENILLGAAALKQLGGAKSLFGDVADLGGGLLSKVGGNLTKGLGIGLIGNLLGDLIGAGAKKGSVRSKAGGVVSDAATGAAIGALIPGFDATGIPELIGGALGGLFGLFKGGPSYTGFGSSIGSQSEASPQTPPMGKNISPVPGVSPSGYYGQQNTALWNGTNNYHTGNDYPVPVGTPVQAVASGVVFNDLPGFEYGTVVQIDHENGYQTLYGHLSSKSVKVGDRVKPGQVIGKSGASGNANGPHLHFEVRKGKNNPVDPSVINSGAFVGAQTTQSFVSGQTETTTGTILGTGTQQQWAKTLLTKLKVPTSTQNVAALTTWAAWEGGQWKNTAHYNPLNTTQPETGASNINSVGVKSYTSWDQGYQATIETLRNGRYGAILNALDKGNDTAAVLKAVNHSPWGTHIPGAGGSSHTGFGASMPSATSSVKSGPTIVNINLSVNQASDEEAIRFAKKVKSYIEKSNSNMLMGSM